MKEQENEKMKKEKKEKMKSTLSERTERRRDNEEKIFLEWCCDHWVENALTTQKLENLNKYCFLWNLSLVLVHGLFELCCWSIFCHRYQIGNDETNFQKWIILLYLVKWQWNNLVRISSDVLEVTFVMFFLSYSIIKMKKIK